MTRHLTTTTTLALALTAILTASIPAAASARGYAYERIPPYGHGVYRPSPMGETGRFGPHRPSARGFDGRGPRGGFERRGGLSGAKR
jgi:hypothetical protein